MNYSNEIENLEKAEALVTMLFWEAAEEKRYKDMYEAANEWARLAHCKSDEWVRLAHCKFSIENKS